MALENDNVWANCGRGEGGFVLTPLASCFVTLMAVSSTCDNGIANRDAIEVSMCPFVAVA